MQWVTIVAVSGMVKWRRYLRQCWYNIEDGWLIPGSMNTWSTKWTLNFYIAISKKDVLFWWARASGIQVKVSIVVKQTLGERRITHCRRADMQRGCLQSFICSYLYFLFYWVWAWPCYVLLVFVCFILFFIFNSIFL